jgi:succinoglycan biosynthesis transport protein ExoP
MLNRLSGITPPRTVDGEHRFDLREVVNFAWREWKFIATVVAVTAVVGIVMLIRQVPLYTASTQILLNPRPERPVGETTTGGDLIFNNGASIENQMEIIKSTALLRRVVEKEKLVPPLEMAASLAPADAGSEGADGHNSAAVDLENLPPQVLSKIGMLRGGLSVTRSKGDLITVSFTSPDSKAAAKYANAIAASFIVDKLDARYEAAQRAAGWLSERLAALRTQVQKSDSAVQAYRAEHNLLQGTTNVTLNQQQLADLNARLVTARADAAEKRARVDLLKSVGDKGGDIQQLLPDMVNSPMVATLRGQIAAIDQRESDLVARYGNGHPLVVNVRAEKRDAERSLANEIQKLSANVKNEYEIAKARADSLEKSLREVTGQVDNSSGEITTLRELERTADVNRTLFEDFLKKAKISQEQSTFEIRDARIITPGLPPGAPSYPNKTRYMTVVALIGVILGIGGALAKELLNAGFTTPKEVEDLLELPLLSSVATMGAGELTVFGKPIQIPQYPLVKPLSRFSESIRAIRSGVQMSDVDSPPKVIQVTSTVPGEGKTTIALSIAASAAASGLRVLFVDADLRRPSASTSLGARNEFGLVDLLLGQSDPQTAIKFNETFRFWSLAAGAKTQSPTDLLSSDRMKSFVAGFRKSFDLVLIDSPPIGPVIDPVVIAQMADKIVYVVRWASTAREMVKHSIDKVMGDKKVAGIVFNQVNDRQAAKYGKHAYSYYYSSRYYRNYYAE